MPGSLGGPGSCRMSRNYPPGEAAMQPKTDADSPRLFSVGHSNHELPAFLDLLLRHGVTAVADVRTHPSK